MVGPLKGHGMSRSVVQRRKTKFGGTGRREGGKKSKNAEEEQEEACDEKRGWKEKRGERRGRGREQGRQGQRDAERRRRAVTSLHVSILVYAPEEFKRKKPNQTKRNTGTETCEERRAVHN